MDHYLEQPIKFLPGVGPRRSEMLGKSLEIRSFRDLLFYFPYKYLDRTRFYQIRDIPTDAAYIQLRGKITRIEKIGTSSHERLVADFTDETGTVLLVFFKGIRYLQQTLHLQTEYILLGKPGIFNGKINFVHPELEEVSHAETSIASSLQAMYNTSEKMKEGFLNSKAILKLQTTLWRGMPGRIPETLSDSLVKRLRLMSLHDALFNIHFPQSIEYLHKAEYRIKLEELLFTQLDILHQKKNRETKTKGFLFKKVGNIFNTFYQNRLPFELTNAQKKVIREIRQDTGTGHQMNRLLQGDVGSGKTLVALMSMLIALDNGYQACLMCPTEILAQQHYQTLRNFLGDMDVQVELLTGNTPKSKRKTMMERLRNGSLQILTGTHALIEEPVQFANLGLAVIDEQHRFGVAQRAGLWNKNVTPPHVLVMTATPIPRTLAMTLYGDLDVSVIDELPAGRKAIQTVHYYDSQRLKMHGFVRRQIKEGRQVYMVFPLIDESDKVEYKDLTMGFNHVMDVFPPPEYSISVLHGQMKPEEKEREMKRFVQGQTQILLATTVIEVGVDVPNATVMVIENAERFGLSQLHQLRGRVGRGSDQSYCILMTPYKISEDGRKRIQALLATSDGFEISETDLKLRGPGELEGTRQSGQAFDLKLANLAKDGILLQYARNLAEEILSEDPELSSPENKPLRKELIRNHYTTEHWGMIS
ncbi:MAG: ATP-dependent DNA helicase RecG [Bacteroidales bacterium]|nr:ATP-dependent DNA helicase RecG [Bacteroidales bacterium]